MIDRTAKLRWRRRYRSRKRQVEEIGSQAEEQLEKHFFRRLTRLGDVRKFVINWVLLLVLLIGITVVQTRSLSGYYQDTVAVPGGAITEGIVGSFTNANPLYATGTVDSAAAQLVFSGLLKINKDDQLVGNLAESWSTDDREVTYTVKLREHIKWHDGTPLTAEDVVFTYKTIQNADAQSPLFNSWQKISVEAADARTVVFTLPAPLSSFAYSLTNGIVPKHILGDVPVTQLRSHRFNTVSPIGSGPFKWERIEVIGTTTQERTEQIGLLPNADFYGEKPKLQHYIIRSFRDDKRMIESFKNHELTAMSGLDSLPDELKNEKGIRARYIPLAGQVIVFLKTSQEYLADVKVRKALVQSFDQTSLIKGFDYPLIASKSPFLPNHIGYNRDLTQLPTNVEEARKLLDEAGWLIGKDNLRYKNNLPLTIRLYSQSNSEYAYVTQQLQEQWRSIGVDVQVFLQQDADFKSTVSNHAYDALLYGVALGPDPDAYAYWHSSQADVRSAYRLNFSEYKSTQADKSLEAGRSRSDPTLRALRYKPFLEAWRADAPALVLYQPSFLFVTRGEINGFDPATLPAATSRYTNVENWMVRLGKANKK
jgi:peptide/nickel transport system substrate-binding protein